MLLNTGIIFATFVYLLGAQGKYLGGLRESPVARTRQVILAPSNPHPEAPECTSYSGLCHLAYNLTTQDNIYQVVHSEQQICRCRDGQEPCNTNWFSNRNAVSRVFKSVGQEVEVKMSYCAMRQHNLICRQNQIAMLTRGRGAFVFEIVSDYNCRCQRQLYAHRSWRDGDYDYIEYSCGKPRCGINGQPSTGCTRITYDGSPNNLIHEYLCRCLRNFECRANSLPTADNPVVMKTCQEV